MDPTSHSVEKPSTLLSQQPAVSPRGHFDNELQKQPSVSSLRDALLSTPTSVSQQQYTPYSPQVPGGHPSPMTPSANFPHTPDASTPAGGSSIMSPHIQQHYEEKNDNQLAESEIINSFAQNSTEEGRSLRVSPFQVESILGIRNDKPIGLDANLGEVNSEGNSILSPGHNVPQPGRENAMHSVSESNSKPASDQPPHSPLSRVDSFSEEHKEDGAVLQVCTCTLYMNIYKMYMYMYVYMCNSV